MTEPAVWPLRARPGARFRCHGDGLCCTDVHTFGPLDDREVEALRAIDPGAVIERDGMRALPVRADGRCVFRTATRCELHARLGPGSKPASCRQFPFLLVATPTGGRIVTEHRCPCRTLGERREVTAAMAEEALGQDPAPDRVIPSSVLITDDQEVELAAWEPTEAALLARLRAGEDPLSVLAAAPLAPADAWRALASDFAEEQERSAFGCAIRRFGATTLTALGEPSDVDASLPWSAAFDRAEARTAVPEDPAAMLSDWLADYVWSLEWAFTASFARARAELATRVVIARAIARDRETEGARADRAMAEAIAVVELAGLASDYEALVAELEITDS